MYAFGKDFNYTFQPLIDGEPVEGIPSQTATLNIFRTKPDRAAAILGTGAISSTSADWGANQKACLFAVDGIDDPTPTSSQDFERYWAAIVFILSEAEQQECHIREIRLERVGGQSDPLVVTASDLQSVSAQVTTYATATEISNHITASIAVTKARLFNRGFDWANIHRSDRLRFVVIYRALKSIYASKIQDSGDKFSKWVDEYGEMANDMLESLRVEYDADKDGAPDDQINTQAGYSIISR